MSAPAHQAFADRMTGILNESCLGLLVGVGHRTGLFDAMAALPPSTSEEVAHAAGLHERWVREWLGGMVTGGIVDHDPATGRYSLPPDHAASLTRAAGPGNLARLAPYLALMGEVEPQVVESFRKGGGVPASAHPGFQALQAELSGPVLDAALVERIVPLVPGLADRLRAGIDVLDIGCGRGRAVTLLAEAFPASRFRGVDLSESGIAEARREAVRMHLGNTTFDVTDAAELDGHYDLITAFHVVHDLAWPSRTLLAVRDALHDDGVFLMGDIAAASSLDDNIGHPLGPLLYGLSVFHCMAVSLAEGGEGLGALWGEQTARRMLAEAGFTRVDTARVEGDPLDLYYVARRG